MKAESTAELAVLLAQAGWLRRFARALVGDASEGEDIAQETLLSAWRRPAPGAGRAWLATVARNLAVDRARGQSRRERREREQAATHDPAPSRGRVASPEELIGDAQIHRHVAEAVAHLAEPFRQTVVLRFYEGLSSADIARHLGQPEGTIRWRVKEALERVRAELDARHDNDRASWMAALAPLLPAPRAEVPAPVRPRRPKAPGPSPLSYVMAAAATVVVSLGTIAIVRNARAPHADAETPATTTQVAPTQGARTARPALPSVLSPSPSVDAADAPGPGSADAQDLAEELLAAVQANDYDGFVAKGSPSFRAALGRERLDDASAQLSGRLSQGRRVSLLGTLHRRWMVEWLYRIQFSDDGDDALVTLAMDGWQVAGFLITAPMPQLLENHP